MLSQCAWVHGPVFSLPEISLSGHNAWIRFWCAALSPAHQETLRERWWAACMPPGTQQEAKKVCGERTKRQWWKLRTTSDPRRLIHTEVDDGLHSKCVLSLGIAGPLLMHVYFLRSASGWGGCGNFNIHATTADPYTGNEPTANLRAESLFWKLFFNPPDFGLLQRDPCNLWLVSQQSEHKQKNQLLISKVIHSCVKSSCGNVSS